MEDYVRVKDESNLVRDIYTNAILNTDYDAYEEYVDTYKRVYQEKQRILKLENEVCSIKNDLDEIKSLLRSLAK